ncbi:MAG TPA: ribonuclease P protein component [Oligoflexia bacterium]|nr:ribonuclease P protein component [Oligoflexia bacterium]HMR25038.1 ribonuclease P protein component [Oligoflexia bacterium]
MFAQKHDFPKKQRIADKKDFALSKAVGKRFYQQHLFLSKSENSCGFARLAVVASRKTGNAVLRNQWKRQIREVFRHGNLQAGDYVVILKPSIKQQSKTTVVQQVKQLFVQHSADKDN